MDEAKSDTPAASPSLGRIGAVKRIYPHAYEPWTTADDVRLVRGYQAGLGFADLAVQFGRQPSAIESRLKKLALERLRARAI